jgi:hypothetical protein
MTREELQQFCADETDLRDCLREPWSRGEFSYATNGHIMIRVARIANVDENANAPDAERVIAGAQQTDFVPVPKCKKPPDVECETCHGHGVHGCGCGTEHDCGNCEGKGTVENLDFMAVGNTTFAQRYLAMIQGWEIAPNGLNPAWIRNGETQGLLMPRRK